MDGYRNEEMDLDRDGRTRSDRVRGSGTGSSGRAISHHGRPSRLGLMETVCTDPEKLGISHGHGWNNIGDEQNQGCLLDTDDRRRLEDGGSAIEPDWKGDRIERGLTMEREKRWKEGRREKEKGRERGEGG